jgi:hypothetical protein
VCLGLTILYEIGDIARLPTVKDFLSYCRLVKDTVASAGKIKGDGKHRKLPVKQSNGGEPGFPTDEPPSFYPRTQVSTGRQSSERRAILACWGRCWGLPVALARLEVEA